ncbi:enhanced serine sensitivity protein SseB C-terminal domain-containing protein [Variovorax sp. M-6]|uniref:enhanced serine sensitivity protein SseB C-terminal domain-containing protein n=1 Tax=Variovorax sp. M-6 TaxID=3233041 RepID=UPI003F9DB453
MSTCVVETQIPVGSRVRIGVPAEQPEEAIAALREHLKERKEVDAAFLGLMEVAPPDRNSYFTYTIGLRCTSVNREEEETAVLEVLLRSSIGRWPISLLPLTDTYFTREAICIFEQEPAPKRAGFLARLLGRR